MTNAFRPSRPHAWHILILRFGPLLLWMVVIYALSTDVASAEQTRPAVGGLLRRVLPWMADSLPLPLVERIDFNIRKTAHVIEYLILAVLAYRAATFGNTLFRNRNVVVPFLLGVLYAATDEYHQSMSASRWGAASDVTLDTFGVTIGLLLCLWHRAATENKRVLHASAPRAQVEADSSAGITRT